MTLESHYRRSYAALFVFNTAKRNIPIENLKIKSTIVQISTGLIESTELDLRALKLLYEFVPQLITRDTSAVNPKNSDVCKWCATMCKKEQVYKYKKDMQAFYKDSDEFSLEYKEIKTIKMVHPTIIPIQDLLKIESKLREDYEVLLPYVQSTANSRNLKNTAEYDTLKVIPIYAIYKVLLSISKEERDEFMTHFDIHISGDCYKELSVINSNIAEKNNTIEVSDTSDNEINGIYNKYKLGSDVTLRSIIFDEIKAPVLFVIATVYQLR